MALDFGHKYRGQFSSYICRKQVPLMSDMEGVNMLQQTTTCIEEG